MTDKPLALRPGQTDWETEMWARAILDLADGKPPDVPVLIPSGAWNEFRAAAAYLLGFDWHLLGEFDE